jgi:CYTH domain-containing protein
VAPLLKFAFPEYVVDPVVIYETPGSVYRQGSTRTSDKNGPGAVNRTGRDNAGQAGMAIYGITDPKQLFANEVRMARSKIREFDVRQPELIGGYVVQMTKWISEYIDRYHENPTRFAPRPVNGRPDKLRIPGHENCARCDMNDEQGANTSATDLEKNPQIGPEKEKKYLVSAEAVADLRQIFDDPVKIKQIYLSDNLNLRVRKVVDVSGATTYLATLKGPKSTDSRGKVIRAEVECEIDGSVFRQFESKRLPHIEKTRYRNPLLPGVTLDIFPDGSAILESEDVTNISTLRRYLISVFQRSYQNQRKIIQSTGNDVDNQQIALSNFDDQPADYIDPSQMSLGFLGWDYGTAQQQALLEEIQKLALA